MRYLKTRIFLVLTMLTFCSCTVKEAVRMDIDNFIKEQKKYIDADVVITATLDDVLSRYDLYRGKKIELSSPFSYFGTVKFWTWYVMLQQGEKKLRCYTHYYRIKASNDALRLLWRARSKKDPITITGVLYNDGIDIEKICCDGITVRPDMIMPGVFSDDINFLPRR